MMINIDVERFLATRDMMIAPRSSQGDIARFMGMVRPMETEIPLVRIGGEADGGYLVPDILDGISACFSPGVGPTSTFESDLARRGIRSFMADGSVDGPNVPDPLFQFERKFLSDVNDEMNLRLEDWVAKMAPDGGDDLLLQMDIEGGEYAVLLDTPSATLRRFKAIVIEFHELGRLLLRDAASIVHQSVRKLVADFNVVHIHPNNNVAVVSRGDFHIPPVMEFTFLRKDIAPVLGPARKFPHPLDAPNTWVVPDIVLPDCWWR